jgi:hypothetical protein
MKHLLLPIAWLLLLSLSFAGGLTVRPVDYWMLELECDSNLPVAESLTVRTSITQPQGFTKILESQVRVSQGKASWQLQYPLIDEGRLDLQSGNWNGYWTMGEYQFRTELLDGSKVIQTLETTLDPMSLCPRDNYGPIFSKYRQQLIECSPMRPAYIDTDHMSFTIRMLPDRMDACAAVVDVTARNDEGRLAGPWNMQLDKDVRVQEFDTTGWPQGEYWIRIRLQKDGKPIGPFLIRKVWKEVLPPQKAPTEPLHIGRQRQLLVGPPGLNSVHNIRFVSDTLKKQPKGPLVTMDRPWETELLYYKSLHRDTNTNQYVLEYEL